MKKALIGLVFGLVLAAQPYGARPGDNRGAYGNGYGNGYGYNVNNFSERIARGERAGLITRKESAKLWSMERNLRREIDRSYRSGFGMSPGERDRINRMSAQLDREISRQMRDRENYRW